MREPGADPIDRLLEVAGERWRATQPSPTPAPAALFEGTAGAARGWFAPDRAWSFVAGSAVAVVVIIAIAVAAPNLLPRFGPAGPIPPASSHPNPGSLPSDIEHCPMTGPDPVAGAPSAAVGDPGYGNEWFGSNRLYTIVGTVGTQWWDLPKTDLGYTQKTFWWRDGYNPDREPTPAIYVTGRRLDGPGSFGFGPGTHAAFGGPPAMLVGIEIPTLGCWEVTARYGSDTLTIVAWVGEVEPRSFDP